MTPRKFLSLLAEAAQEWMNDNAMRLSAALAYYAVFSLAPLLIIVISIAGIVFGHQAARGEIGGQISQFAGQQIADAVQSLVQSTSQKSTSVIATILGVATLLFGASGVFGELKDSMNVIWGVTAKPGRAVLTLIRDRFLSFAMVLGTGFLLLISLVLTAAVSAVGAYMSHLLPMPEAIWHGLDLVVSFAVVTALFALIFKLLPNVVIQWREVWVGAVCTAFLFTLGKFLIGLYLGKSGVGSSYGAAGSVIIILLWVYYSTCIMYFGAEFTKVFARRDGSQVRPDGHALLLTDVMRSKLGIVADQDVARAAARQGAA